MEQVLVTSRKGHSVRTRPFWLCNPHGQNVWGEQQGSDACPAFIKGNYFLFTLYRMALLPNNTLANPLNSFYALASAGPASSLQSPVDLVPESNGDTQLNIVSSTGAGEAGLLVSSTNGNDSSVVINSTGGGNASLSIGQAAAPGGTGLVSIYAPGAVVGGGQINIGNGSTVGGSDNMVIDTINNNIIIGSGTSAGLTTIKNGLLVSDQFVTNNTNGIGLTMTAAANTGVIAMNTTSGVLNLGSGSQNPDILQLIDGGGADSGGCKIGGNGGLNLQIQGGTVAAPTPIIGTDNNGSINGSLHIGTGGNNPAIIALSDTLNGGGTGVATIVGTVFNTAGVTIPQNLVMGGTIGSSAANPATIFVRDTGAAGTGYVDIATGVPAGIALRLQGANTQVGANTAQVSTNNNAAAAPILNINNSVDGTPAIVVSSTTVRINKLITGYLNGTTAAQAALADNTSVGIPGSDYGSLGAGLFSILVKNGNQTSTGQPGVQVSVMGYMSATTTTWIGGCGFGQALINPTRNFYIQPSTNFTGLVFGNTAGFDMNSTWTVTFIRLTGDLGI